MSAARRIVMLFLESALASACDAGQTDQLQNELMLMQERLVELESQVADAQGHAERLATAAAQLEAFVLDVEKEVIDLSMTEVRARVNALNTTLDSQLE